MRWEGNVKVWIREMGYEDVKRTELAQYHVQWWILAMKTLQFLLL
jgi:hypothetical protein